jgi:hypothetical protein
MSLYPAEEENAVKRITKEKIANDISYGYLYFLSNNSSKKLINYSIISKIPVSSSFLLLVANFSLISAKLLQRCRLASFT